MSTSGGILLRGIRWRLGASLLTVLTATIAVGVAVLGPLYLRTAGDSVLRTTVNAAAVADRGASVIPRTGGTATLAQVERADRAVEYAGGPHRFYGQPITTAFSGVGLVGPGSSPLRSMLFWRTGICGVLRFRSGGCDLAHGNVVLSDRSASEMHVSTGAIIDASLAGRRAPLRLKVAGIYRVPDLGLSYWWGQGPGYFSYGYTTGPNHVPELDPMISSPATALAVLSLIHI